MHEGNAMIRLIHFSDVHLTTRPLGWHAGDFFTKRLPGWINLRWLGREHRFRHSEEVLSALMAELKRNPPDRIVFSGDATGLGFESELVRAVQSLGINQSNCLPGLAVPGNHDYYTPAVAASGLFEKYFAPWQQGERVDGATYPFAQRVGPVWLIGVNSCTGNRAFWDATGRVDELQLERLRRLLNQLEDGPRILVTHYPITRPGGEPERSDHRLRNLADLVRVASEGKVALWLHGHQHIQYAFYNPAKAPIPTSCAGSLTQTGKWSFYEYQIDQERLRAQEKTYSADSRGFQEEEGFELRLAGH
jgi:3',5'-cyclic AMP phosphodiesterase CpdA